MKQLVETVELVVELEFEVVVVVVVR